jgi:putative NADPH-quinone reductase
MARRIVLIQGHPDGGGGHFGHALQSAYQSGAQDSGHEVRTINVAALDFPVLRSARDWDSGALPAALGPAQEAIAWAEHIAIFFPLWLGDMPARLKGFFEQVLRPGFAIREAKRGRLGGQLLEGRSARLVVTMGMPAFFYRLYYRSHSVKSLKRNVLEFCGISPVRTSLVGTVEGDAPGGHEIWLAKMRTLGAAAR